MKKALLVGINKYATPGNDLRGCINDILNLRDCKIKYYGYKTEDIRLLTDERATTRKIRDRHDWLFTKLTKGDSIAFQQSSHGSQVRDRDGDELRDRLDEIICPYDFDWDGNFITDDELWERLMNVPKGVSVDVFLDSCHSGTMLKGIASPASPYSPHMRDKFVMPPADIEYRRLGSERNLIKKGFARLGSLFGGGAADTREQNPNVVLFAGCKDSQTSADAELGGWYNGAFTYFLCEHIRATEGKASRGELVKLANKSLKKAGFTQVAQCEGTEEMKGLRIGEAE